MRFADIDIVAFGPPRPMHRHWVRHCRNIRAEFHLFTDRLPEWEHLLGEMDASRNMTLRETSIDKYFTRAAVALGLGGLEDFVATCGPHMHNRLNGWTACAFKPLLPVMFPRRSALNFYGWMDWDVFLTNRLLDRLMQWAPQCTDLSLFTPRGIRWEQFKLFPRTAMEEIVREFREGVVGGGYKRETPFDVQFVYDERRIAHEQFCPVAQTDIAVHWKYLETIGPESDPNKLDVTVTPDAAHLQDVKSGREILMFIADEEVKTMSEDDIGKCLSADGRTLRFPYISPEQAENATTTNKRLQEAANRRHHCIVTPDFIGPVKNGGIGTATFHQARFLRRELGHEVTVVFTGPVQNGTAEDWRARYAAEDGITFLTLGDLPCNPDIPHHCTPWFLERSYRVHNWLRTRRFDVIHFQDWQANGFVPIQAKQQGLAYETTLLTCTLHSPQEWVDEGSRRFPSGGLDDILQRYAERYAACRADLTLAPSRHMLEWAQRRGWQPRRAEIVPYLWTSGEAKTPPPGPRPVTELCFFGRWETRKGLEVFTGALERLARQLGPEALPRISFLGKPGLVADGCGRAHIEQAGRRLGLPVVLMDDLDSKEAQDYLAARPGCVAVMPSLWDNLPYTVIECLQNGVNFLASDAGGVPELIASPEHIFHPDERGLAEALERVITQGITPVRSAYDASKAAALWTRLAAEHAPKRPRRQVEPEDVTVCIAHYNHGRYLPDLLESLAQQTATGFHVIVVDDGSTDTASVATFQELERSHAARGTWRFLRKANGGIGETRNFAVARSGSRYLIFLDADNIAAPRMVETMVEAMRVAEADCLTCYFEGFTWNENGSRRPVYRYLPMGGCLEAGLFMNVFGDANCIIDRSAFHAVGGFSTEKGLSYEDWDLLARLCLDGHRVDTIPEIIHHYRHTADGFSRSSSRYLNLRRIIDAYAARMSPWAGAMLDGIYATVMPEANASPGPDPEIARLVAERDALIVRQARRIEDIEKSTSMRLTAPLRLMSIFIRRTFSRPEPVPDPPPADGQSAADPLAERDRTIEVQSRKLRDLESSVSWRISLPVRMAGSFCRRAEKMDGLTGR